MKSSAIFSSNLPLLYFLYSLLLVSQLDIHSVQFSSFAQSCPTLRPRELQHTRPPCPSSTLRVYTNSCPLSWWCHPAISSLSSPSPPAPYPSQRQCLFLFTRGGQSTGVSALASVFPVNTQDLSPLGGTCWISLQSKGLFSNTIVRKHQFFGAQLSLQSNSHFHTWLLEKPQPWLDGPLWAN